MGGEYDRVMGMKTELYPPLPEPNYGPNKDWLQKLSGEAPEVESAEITMEVIKHAAENPWSWSVPFANISQLFERSNAIRCS
jgi:hypothetical protein